MTHSTFDNLGATLGRLAHDIVLASRRVLREIAAMPWPVMLVFCVLLAAIISILPLALCLFVLFLGLKVVAGAFIIDRRRDTRHKA